MNIRPNIRTVSELGYLLGYIGPVVVAPWDFTDGTVPYKVNSSTTSTHSDKSIRNYWAYDRVSVSESRIL